MPISGYEMLIPVHKILILGHKLLIWGTLFFFDISDSVEFKKQFQNIWIFCYFFSVAGCRRLGVVPLTAGHIMPANESKPSSITISWPT